MLKNLGICLALCVWLATPLPAANTIEIEGFTEPFRKVDVAPSEPGMLDKLLVREGDRVSKEQVVARLDSDVLAVMLESAQATLAATGRHDSAVAESALRKSRLEKMLLLREKGHAIQEEVERARTDLAVAEANVRTAREQQAINALECKRIEALIERRAIRSPIDGTVLKVFREEHEFISGATPVVLTLVQLDRLKAQFAVPSTELRLFQTGGTATVRFPEGNLVATGTIDFVSPVTDPESGTVRLQVVIDNAAGTYRSGAKCLLVLSPAAGQL